MKFSKKSEYSIYAWGAIGFSSVNSAMTMRSAFLSTEIIGLVAVALLSMFMFAVSVHRWIGKGSVRESVLAYKDHVLRGNVESIGIVGTVGLTVIAQALAIQLGSGKDLTSLAVAEGIRTGVFFLVAVSAWRLSSIGRLVVIVTWIATDIWVFKSVVIPGIGDSLVTWLTGCVSGFVLMWLQSLLDDRIQTIKNQ